MVFLACWQKSVGRISYFRSESPGELFFSGKICFCIACLDFYHFHANFWPEYFGRVVKLRSTYPGEPLRNSMLWCFFKKVYLLQEVLGATSDYRPLNESFRQVCPNCSLWFQVNVLKKSHLQKVCNFFAYSNIFLEEFRQKFFGRVSVVPSTCPREHFENFFQKQTFLGVCFFSDFSKFSRGVFQFCILRVQVNRVMKISFVKKLMIAEIFSVFEQKSFGFLAESFQLGR